MNVDGQHYLETLARLPADTFESRFAKTVIAVGLDSAFDRNELKLLYETSDKAFACNLAINGIGAPEQQIRPQDESTRGRLERQFMLARDLFFASPGWQNLNTQTRQQVEETFLDVSGLDNRLAW